MAEVTQYTFSYKEVIEALIKQQGIHEGIWSIRVEFGMGAINVNTEEGSKDITPAAIIAVKSIGLQAGTEINSLTVDAAEVNPRPKGSSKKSK